MTWNELNERTGDMLPDMVGAAWYDLVNDGMDDEPIWRCQTIDMVLEVLSDVYDDMPSDYDAEMLDNQQLRTDIRKALA